MTEPMINLPEFARRAGIPYPTMWRHAVASRLPEPDASVGATKLWRKPTADKWIKAQGAEPRLPPKPRPMPKRVVKAGTPGIRPEPDDAA